MSSRVLRFVCASFLLLSLSACSTTKIGSYAERYGPCDPLPCLTLSIAEIPDEWFLTLTPEASERIRNELSSILFSGAHGEGEQNRAISLNTLEGLRSELSSRFQEEFGSGGTTSTVWFVERDLQKIFENKEVFTVEVSSRGYLGGAHDFEEKNIVSFEKISGKKIQLEDLIAPYSRQILSSISAIEFRRAFSVPLGQTLEESGFLIKNTVDFPISENVGIVGGGLMVHFNPYEIAPYSKGSFTFVLPFDALEPILRTDGVGDGKIRAFFKGS